MKTVVIWFIGDAGPETFTYEEIELDNNVLIMRNCMNIRSEVGQHCDIIWPLHRIRYVMWPAGEMDQT